MSKVRTLNNTLIYILIVISRFSTDQIAKTVKNKKQKLKLYCSVGNHFFQTLAILASCFKIVLAKLELHLPSLASG